ncbi:MAG: 3-deoxy-D-manno-octulosonic acid transferase [Acidobacteriota bacterium]
MGFLKRLGWWVYQLVMASGLLLAAPFLIARRGSHYLRTLRGRLGLDSDPAASSEAQSARHSPTVWIHAVSVGEVAVAATLAARLPSTHSLVVTTVTPTGQERARAAFSASSRRPARVAYLPFDLGFAVDRFYRRFNPHALILVEGDYWPLVLDGARRRGLPVAVVNARVGERSSQRLRRVPRLARALFFEPVHRFAVQAEQDRERLIAAGAEASRIHVAGNLKFDATAPDAKPELEAAVRRVADGRPILLAGSTMLGEDEQVLDAFERLGGDRALLVIAPRHPERFDAVFRMIRGRGLRVQRRSEPESSEDRTDVLVLDTLGELAALYRVADVAFIGGTLVPTGGHNPLEPASFAVPTVVGPSMHNFRDMARRFDVADAWRRVEDSRQLAELWETWLAEPEQARAVGQRAAQLLATNRGAVERTVELLEPILAEIQQP